MLQSVDIAPRRLEDYRASIGSDALDELRALAAPLRGARVLQINATPYGAITVTCCSLRRRCREP